MPKIHTLTGLRFLAAFYVFAFHVHLPMHTPSTWLPSWMQTIISQGFLGVTTFFVLSGFVLTYSHLKDFPTAEVPQVSYWGRFLYKRLARLYPAFLAGWLASLLLSLRLHNPPTWWLALMSATFTQTYFFRIAMRWYDIGAWSVANEWFFYLLFPLLLPVALHYLRSSRAVAVALAGVIALQAGLSLAIYLNPAWNQQLNFYCFPPARLPEFLAGILIGLGVLRFGWRVPAWVAMLAVVVELVWLAYAPSAFSQNRLAHHVTLVPVLVGLLIALAQPQQSPMFSWLATRPMQYLGKISYCFYIAQIPLLVLLDALLNKDIVQHTSALVLPVGLLINLGAAAVVHHVVEKPAHTWLMRRYSHPALQASTT
ncbi:MAG: acyltransferase family protein [Janthinobacterium lividum]